MITITVNGNAQKVDANIKVADLLEQLGLTGKRIAVEKNREIIPRSALAAEVLNEGDSLEIVHAIGGG